jgi:hypothetical protein
MLGRIIKMSKEQLRKMVKYIDKEMKDLEEIRHRVEKVRKSEIDYGEMKLGMVEIFF